MLEAYLEDFKGLEEDCKDLIVSAYIDHRAELSRIPKLPVGAIVIGDNWSYSARSYLAKEDLRPPTNFVARELKKREIKSIQYLRLFPDENGGFGDFENMTLTHLKLFRRDSAYNLDLGLFLSLFVIGDNRLKEIEDLKREWDASMARAGHTIMPRRIFFLYDSQLQDKGTIIYHPNKT